MPSLDSGTVHEDIDLVAVFQDLWGEGLDVGLGREVCSVNDCFAAESFYELLGSCVREVALYLVSICPRFSLKCFQICGRGRKCTCIKMMSAPHSARETATACPIPLVPPVITAVWPSSEKLAIVVEVAILKSFLNCS
jgi:hypothetical protein